MNTWTQLIVISSVAEGIIGMECTNSVSGRIPTLVSLACGVRFIAVPETNWAYTYLYQKQYHIPRGILQISATTAYFKEAKINILTIFIVNLPTV
jgi:hypothetical protein